MISSSSERGLGVGVWANELKQRPLNRPIKAVKLKTNFFIENSPWQKSGEEMW
jgi:hypothetical protein